MLIKEAAKLTGLTERAIRFYEEAGLIRPAMNASGFRDYHDADIRQLKQIASLRSLGFSLDEIQLFQNHPGQIPALFDAVHDRQKDKINRTQSSAERLAAIRRAGERVNSPEDWVHLLEMSGGLQSEPGGEIHGGAQNVPHSQSASKQKFFGGYTMRESRMSGIAMLVGLCAVVLGIILAIVYLVSAYANRLPFPIGNALLILAVLGVPGICALALAEVLENQQILHQQNHRTQLFLMDMAGDDTESQANQSQSGGQQIKTWQCPQCKGLNEGSTLFCRHCNALRDLRKA